MFIVAEEVRFEITATGVLEARLMIVPYKLTVQLARDFRLHTLSPGSSVGYN